MALTRSMVGGAAILVAVAVAAAAQPVQPTPFPYNWLFGPYQYAYTSPAPLSWYYNPYTSGLGPCPQRFPGDPPCSDMIQPSFGQPSYWSR
jgi:hypothetical protein